MTLAVCQTAVDSSGRELAEHGTCAFPIACYQDDLYLNEVPWHWHEELEAGIVTVGAITLTVGQEKRTLHAGEGFFINSGALHGAYAAGDPPCRIHSLVFHPRLVGGWEGSIFYQRYLRPITEDPTLEWVILRPGEHWQEQALEAITRAWEGCVQEEEGFEFLVRGSLSELIDVLRRHIPSAQVEPSSRAIRDSARIKAMLSCIHEHYGSNLTIRQIAASASISESECLRCFRASIGAAPIQYLKQYRLRMAAAQLLASPDSITEIASRCGFQDMSYFTKSFRQIKGCTPSEYRKKQNASP